MSLKEDYEKLKKEYENLKFEYDSLKFEYDDLCSDLEPIFKALNKFEFGGILFSDSDLSDNNIFKFKKM